MLNIFGGRGNTSTPPAGFIRIAPSIVLVTANNDINLLTGGFANSAGNHATNPRNNIQGVLIPNSAKGIIVDVWSSITSRNLVGDRFNTFKIYDDMTYTNQVDRFDHHCYEQVATAGTVSLSSLDFIMLFPFQADGKVYYNIANDTSPSNFDYFLIGYWD